MSLVTVNFKPTDKELRSFGRISLIMLTIIAVVLWKFKGLPVLYVRYICAAGVAIFVLSLISAKLVKPIYVGMQLVTFPIGLVLSYIIMAIFYYLILAPVGLFFKLIGKDSLNRKYDRQAKTYWVRYNPPDSVGRYFRQF